MSYILDALRKSEEQRRGAGAPDLTTEHRTLATGHGSSARLPALIAIALLANALVLGTWLLWPDGTGAPVAAPPAGMPASAPAAAPATVPEPVPEPVSEPVQSPVAAATSAPAAFQTPDRTPAALPVPIRELPERLQARIPTLSFSTHIYAAEPQYREVAINGQRYAEGARIGALRLVEITETGVVMELDGARFAVSVLDDWDY